MCGIKNKRALFVLILLFSSATAHAKKVSFSTGVPFGLGFRASVASAPDTTLVAAPRTASASFSRSFSAEPFFDLTNLVIRGYATLHRHPNFAGEGTGFTETSSASAFHYGVAVLLAPFVSQDATSRAYAVIGVGQAQASFKTTRTLTSGVANLERAKASTQEITAGLGFEAILVQNYSIQLEAGFRRLNYGRITYESEFDRTGTARGKGEVILDSTTGKNSEFDQGGAFGSLAFNLNF